MNYWDELNAVDSTIVELELIKSNMRLISNAVECSNYTDVQQAIECVTSSFENIMVEMRDNFENLFSTIRNSGTGISTLKTNEYVQPTESVLELDSIVRNWSVK